jgi:hypothetical protein
MWTRLCVHLLSDVAALNDRTVCWECIVGWARERVSASSPSRGSLSTIRWSARCVARRLRICLIFYRYTMLGSRPCKAVARSFLRFASERPFIFAFLISIRHLRLSSVRELQGTLSSAVGAHHMSRQTWTDLDISVDGDANVVT